MFIVIYINIWIFSILPSSFDVLYSHEDVSIFQRFPLQNLACFLNGIDFKIVPCN